jgi:hypothetical protein
MTSFSFRIHGNHRRQDNGTNCSRDGTRYDIVGSAQQVENNLYQTVIHLCLLLLLLLTNSILFINLTKYKHFYFFQVFSSVCWKERYNRDSNESFI